MRVFAARFLMKLLDFAIVAGFLAEKFLGKKLREHTDQCIVRFLKKRGVEQPGSSSGS
jgi:hypothetical protein